MKRTLIGLTTALVAVLSLAACGGSSSPLQSGSGPSTAGSITVGSANFTESQLLAQIYVAALKAKGVAVTAHLNIGSREQYIPALKDGSIDLMPEYTGTLLQYLNKNATQTAPTDVYNALKPTLPAGLTVLDMASAQDKDAVVVTSATATQYNLKSIADLTPVGSKLAFGGPPEFQTRPDGIPGLTKNYGVNFASYKSLDAGGPLTVTALKDGAVQAADLFTTDSSIPTNHFVVLDDPKNNFAAQNVVPLINAAKVTPTISQVLNAISAKLDTATLAQLDATAAGPSKPDLSTVATDWLHQVGLI
jgi:osmoprotectant transport system substrate-binding protein